MLGKRWNPIMYSEEEGFWSGKVPTSWDFTLVIYERHQEVADEPKQPHSIHFPQPKTIRI